jgi:uncharacterized protein (TIGR02147 family)
LPHNANKAVPRCEAHRAFCRIPNLTKIDYNMIMRFSKSIFEYDNYRNFLRDAYLYSKTINKNFSFRFFSKTAGFKSPNILKLVMDGDRNIAPGSIDKFVKAFKMSKDEAAFFKNLVHLNQAKTTVEKQSFAEEILKQKAFRKSQPLKESQYQFFSKWYYVVIREMVAMENFKEDYTWIARQLRPRITASEAKTAVEQLLILGLIARENHGKLIQTDRNVATPDEVTASSIAACHRELMKVASLSIDTIPRNQRDISAIAIAVNEEASLKIKEKIQKFRKEIMDLAAQGGEPDRVYQLNFQFFPTVVPGDGGEDQ